MRVWIYVVCVFQESSSVQFGPEFCSLPPPTTGFTALALTGNILQPRSSTDTPKRVKTEAFVESASTSITLPARTTPSKYFLIFQFSMFSQDFSLSIYYLSMIQVLLTAVMYSLNIVVNYPKLWTPVKNIIVSNGQLSFLWIQSHRSQRMKRTAIVLEHLKTAFQTRCTKAVSLCSRWQNSFLKNCL